MVFTTLCGSLTLEDLNSRGFMVKFLKKGIKKVWSWVGGGSGEFLGGVVGEETVTRMYCMEKHFQ